jgi:hypothetical protein
MSIETRGQTTTRFIKEAMDQLAIDDVQEVCRANKQAEACGCSSCRTRAKALETMVYDFWNEKEFKETGVVYKKKKHA